MRRITASHVNSASAVVDAVISLRMPLNKDDWCPGGHLRITYVYFVFWETKRLALASHLNAEIGQNSSNLWFLAMLLRGNPTFDLKAIDTNHSSKESIFPLAKCVYDVPSNGERKHLWFLFVISRKTSTAGWGCFLGHYGFFLLRTLKLGRYLTTVF